MAYKHLLAVLSVLGPLSIMPERAGAAPVLKPFGIPSNPESLIGKVHGFHCRPELGWNPTTGYYDYHRHEKICPDFNRCLSVHRKCIRVHARGWNDWEFEKWGWDNWKYTSCMLRYDCY